MKIQNVDVLSPIALTLYFLITTNSRSQAAIGFRRCPNCGQTAVPYPLTTASGCGDPQYPIRCSAGTLWFDSLNGSSYMITSIDPTTQRLIIRPPGFAPNSCLSADFKSQGIELDSGLAFNITSSNTVFIFNCTVQAQQLFPFDCTSSSLCHHLISSDLAARAYCDTPPGICCWFRTGGSATEYRIRVQPDRCSAYMSYVNLDTSFLVNKWPDQGVEIEWALPREPLCNESARCEGLANSKCLPDREGMAGQRGLRRCFCNPGFMWDPVNGICKDPKCPPGRLCKHQKNKLSILGGSVSAACTTIFVILAILVAMFVRKQRENVEAGDSQVMSLTKARRDLLSANNRLVKFFTGKDLRIATNNFSKSNLLGSGGFGEVFRGVLDDGTTVAVKRAKLGNTGGIVQIINEVRILCEVNHVNLVKLLGCCVELHQPILVYEYVSNGTLFDHLHTTCTRAKLTWGSRLRIAHQTAQGLAYLHSAVSPPIYHRDVKPSNILLDHNLDAKVSDFGISRLAVSDATHITTSAQGTVGYLDPEYYLNFQLTDKSDVYSFGVVMLELLTSKKALDFNREEEEVNLAVLVRKVIREERLMDVVDPVLKEGAGEVELETMKAVAFLAQSCLNDRRQLRPSMRQVAQEIESIMNVITTK